MKKKSGTVNTNRGTAKIKASENDAAFPVVGIGASAGGIEAVTEFLKNLSPSTGMAFVYVQHLDASHESMLATILSRVTQMKVLEAVNNLKLIPDHFYVIPPNKELTIDDGSLQTSARPSRPGIHMPIDHFFLSLASNRNEKAIGVLLSGSATDGTIGLKAIRNAGGITFVQDASAKFQGMPKSAIAEGAADRILSPAQIAAELEQISRKPELFKQYNDPEGVPNEDLSGILEQLQESSGVDFTHYKVNTIRRRIVRRMLLLKLDTLKEYGDYLQNHPNEFNLLYHDLLINVSSFFREPEVFEHLKKNIFPKLLNRKDKKESVRIWVPACSTGEEVYSIAILIMELMDNGTTTKQVQIFATDLSERVIAKARLALYSDNELVNVSPKRIQQFFTKINGSYRVNKTLRDLCIFAPHNVFRDPPFSRIDFISCCNLLIYLDTHLQQKILSTFYYALNPDGYLMLGKSETIGTSVKLFGQIDKKLKIYTRKNDTGVRAVIDMAVRSSTFLRGNGDVAGRRSIHEISNVPDIDEVIDEWILTNHMPATVVVNKELEILHFRGETSLFLKPSPGRASLNLMKMANQSLAFELRNLVHKAGKSGKTVKNEGIEIKEKEAGNIVSLTVAPVAFKNYGQLFLIIFESKPFTENISLKSAYTKDKLVKHLREELEQLKLDLGSIVEEQEASNEELQSANEEIVSSNEELQSINEELETSKEEVESTNEELVTINTELQVRNEQLAEAYEYAEIVFSTIREAVLILDENLRVKSANRAFYKIFQTVEEETEGMLLYELGNRQWNVPKLREMLYDIIPNNTHFQGMQVIHHFGEEGEKILLLNARKLIHHRQQLILVTIEDITEIRNAERALIDKENWLINVSLNAPVMLWAARAENGITFANDAWVRFSGEPAHKLTGNGWLTVVHPEDRQEAAGRFKVSLEAGNPFIMHFRLKKKNGGYGPVELTGQPYHSNNQPSGFTGSVIEKPSPS
jgi:two-component system CheB/CheR fusion protein